MLSALAALPACDDVGRLRTTDETVYRGDVVGDEADSFIRRGFAPGTELELEFDPSVPDRRSPGVVTTTPDPVTAERVFDATPLEAIPPLQHDLLSEYSFPGSGRIRNYLYVARPSAGPLAGRDAMVFLSLLDSGGIELRVIAGSGETAGDHFGVFPLHPGPR